MIRQANLPSNVPERLIVIPTMNRWTSALPRLLDSLDSVEDGRSESYTFLVADGTPETNKQEARARERTLSNLSVPMQSRVFVITPESQASIVDSLCAKSGVEREVVEAYLTWTGYGSQRGKLDLIARGYAVNGGCKHVLTLDDDTTIPRYAETLDLSLVDNAPEQVSNSQVIMPNEAREDRLRVGVNSLEGFFSSLGKEIPAEMPRSRQLRDTMHSALEEIQRTKQPTRFEVTVDPCAPLSTPGRIVATVATKCGVPDYRTITIAASHIRERFPDREVPFTSYAYGPSREFAFQGATTNVDSACLARVFDSRTSQIGWWLITNDAISRRNALGTVTGHYRADNELLPNLLVAVSQGTGKGLFYCGGIDTHVLHHRARSGYRPDTIEQATASLLGNLVAQAALEHLEVDSTTWATFLRPVLPSYQIEDEKMHGVFESLRGLSQLAREGLERLNTFGAPDPSDPCYEEIVSERGRFKKVLDALNIKTASFDYATFAQHAHDEIRQQLEFYRRALNAAPKLEGIICDMIRRGEYPAMRGVTPSMASSVTLDSVELGEPTLCTTMANHNSPRTSYSE